MRPFLRHHRSRVGAALVFFPVFLTASGCCGLFEPGEAATRKWVNAEIPVGADADTAQQSLSRHGFPIGVDFNPPMLYSNKHVGSCLITFSDDYVRIDVFFDSKGHVTRTEVKKYSEGL